MKRALSECVENSRDQSYPRAIARLLAVCVVFCVFTQLAAAGTDTYVVNGGRSVGGIRIGQTLPGEAIDLFGGPRLLRTDRGDSCLGNWPEIGLTIRFFSFDHGPCWAGVAVTVTITSRNAWRTAVGLRVGDSVARVRSLYPQALRQTQFVGAWNGYWLVTRSACAQTGRWGYPALLARVRQGQVTALVASGSVCDVS